MPVRVVIVGAGGIAKRHGEAIAANENAEIVGTVDVDQAKAAASAAQYGGRPYDTLAECLPQAAAGYLTSHRSV